MAISRNQLLRMGVPKEYLGVAARTVDAATEDAKRRGTRPNFVKRIASIVENPENCFEDRHFGELARELARHRTLSTRQPISINSWGKEFITDQTVAAFTEFAQNPYAVAAALMPDAHGGKGMPVGGVIALDDAICPGAVGLDIACRMKLSVLDCEIPGGHTWNDAVFEKALFAGTCFGFGETHTNRQQHEVMDKDWSVTKITKRRKTKAWSQLGTSGGGNHFVEFGMLTLKEQQATLPPGQYVALLSHSGSRGTGADVAKWYADIALNQSRQRGDSFCTESTASLTMDSEAGQEYWAAMNLMGDYAKANHDVIHANLSRIIGAEILVEIENHHNFCWKENHFGKEVYVHRKGATPAQAGRLGIIPGSMDSVGHVVVGKGHPESLDSASHGAGRQMDRGQAKAVLKMSDVQKELVKHGVRLLQGSLDEAPGVYKDINHVMLAQQDLVDTIATFQPKVVRMAGKRLGAP